MDFLPALTNGNLIFLEQMGIVELSKKERYMNMFTTLSNARYWKDTIGHTTVTLLVVVTCNASEKHIMMIRAFRMILLLSFATLITPHISIALELAWLVVFLVRDYLTSTLAVLFIHSLLLLLLFLAGKWPELDKLLGGDDDTSVYWVPAGDSWS